MLVEASREDSGGGRPRARLRIDPHRGLLVGVDVAETYIHVDVFDTALTRLTRKEHQIQESSDPHYLVDEIAGAVREALAGHRDATVLGTGVSLPGQVQPDAGVSVFAPNWGWHQVPVQDLLAARLGRPVHLDNPLKATTVTELWFGHGRECPDLVTVNLGTGVGAGIAIDGHLVRGRDEQRRRVGPHHPHHGRSPVPLRQSRLRRDLRRCARHHGDARGAAPRASLPRARIAVAVHA